MAALLQGRDCLHTVSFVYERAGAFVNPPDPFGKTIFATVLRATVLQGFYFPLHMFISSADKTSNNREVDLVPEIWHLGALC